MAIHAAMTGQSDKPSGEEGPSQEERPSREDRLAAKLRENLKRRKSQARALDARGDAKDDAPLSKTHPKS